MRKKKTKSTILNYLFIKQSVSQYLHTLASALEQYFYENEYGALSLENVQTIHIKYETNREERLKLPYFAVKNVGKSWTLLDRHTIFQRYLK